MGYSVRIAQLKTALEWGIHRICVSENFMIAPPTLFQRFFSFPKPQSQKDAVLDCVRIINTTNAAIERGEEKELKKIYLLSLEFFGKWNRTVSDMRIEFSGYVPADIQRQGFETFYVTPSLLPLVMRSQLEEGLSLELVAAQEDFCVLEMSTDHLRPLEDEIREPLKGRVPAASFGQGIDPSLPSVLLCEKVFDEGGATLFYDLEGMTRSLQEQEPLLWKALYEESFTVTGTYLPSVGGATCFFQFFNSHYPKITDVFPSEEIKSITELCHQHAISFRWDDFGRLILFKENLSPVFKTEGSAPRFGNHFHLFVNSLREHVKWAGHHCVLTQRGNLVSCQVARRILKIVEENTLHWSWKEGQVMVLNKDRFAFEREEDNPHKVLKILVA